MQTLFKSIWILFLWIVAFSATANITPIVGFAGGVTISSDLGDSQQFSHGYSQYQYTSDSSTQTRGIWGVMGGVEWELQEPYTLQSTIAFYDMASFSAEGYLKQGVELEGSTPFDYSYIISSQQLLWENKLLFNLEQKYYPYFLIGLGVAFNHQKDYDINYPADLIFTPFYDDNQDTSFSYTLGLGLDYQVMDDLRLGMSYRFADLGKAALGQRTLDPINPIPISGTLDQSQLYTQTILLQFTYGV